MTRRLDGQCETIREGMHGPFPSPLDSRVETLATAESCAEKRKKKTPPLIDAWHRPPASGSATARGVRRNKSNRSLNIDGPTRQPAAEGYNFAFQNYRENFVPSTAPKLSVVVTDHTKNMRWRKACERPGRGRDSGTTYEKYQWSDDASTDATDAIATGRSPRSQRIAARSPRAAKPVREWRAGISFSSTRITHIAPAM